MRITTALTGTVLAGILLLAAVGCAAPKYVHSVYFTCKPGTPDSEIDALVADCCKLLAAVPTVRRIETGRRDPAAAVALYARLVGEHADSPWVELAETYQALLEWQQAAEKAAPGAPAAAGSGSTQAPAATTVPAAPPAARGGAG